MGLRCYLSLKTSSTLVVFIELVSCATIAALCILSWQSMDQSPIFIHYPTPKESHDVTNSKLKACVTFWILTSVFAMVCLRLVLAAILFTAVNKKSVGLAQGWIALKILLFICAIFTSIASMTVDFYTRVTALADLGFHVITLYYIKILYESLGELQKVFIVEKNEVETS